MNLQNLCTIGLKNMMFVRDWIGYGQFMPRTTDEFHPGEKFSVYVEIENPTVKRTQDMYEVVAAISYKIIDEDTRVIERIDLGQSREGSISRKRDYCFGFDGTIPANLSPGQYFLRVSITDLHDPAKRFADEQIPFRVVPAMR